MATFPAIEPDERSFDMGKFPMSASGSVGGDQVRFNHVEEATGHDLSLTFLDRSDLALEDIREHYRGQGSEHVSFQLPSIIWQGHSTSSDIVPIEGRWVYAGPPAETHKSGGIHDVDVRLRYVGNRLTA